MTPASYGETPVRKRRELRPLTKEEQDLFMRNYGLAWQRAIIMALAQHMRDRTKRWKRKFWELVDEYLDACSIGLCLACLGYDRHKGRFSVYAYRCIQTQAIIAARAAELKIDSVARKRRVDLVTVTLFGHDHRERWRTTCCRDDFVYPDECDVVSPYDKEPSDPEHLAYLKRLLRGLLGERRFHVFWLWAVEGCNFRQLAKARGTSHQNIEQMVSRSLVELRASPKVAKALQEFSRDPREVRRHEAKDVFISTSERR